MDALAYAVDVACVGGVPERGGMALVGFRRKEELEGDVGGRGRVVQQRVRLVVRADLGAQLSNALFYTVSGLKGERQWCEWCSRCSLYSR